MKLTTPMFFEILISVKVRPEANFQHNETLLIIFYIGSFGKKFKYLTAGTWNLCEGIQVWEKVIMQGANKM